MKSQKYIKEWLDTLCKSFTNIHVQYAFDKNTNFHLVHVLPESYNNNEEYAAMVLDFEANFFKKYPTEDIIISEPDIDDDMSNILYEKRCESIPANINEDDHIDWNECFTDNMEKLGEPISYSNTVNIITPNIEQENYNSQYQFAA
ncbi:MAG TPA: hypothetical protein P5134_06990 [Bacteroidales bacterium]|jgi:hypothetical protein|nr:hypothetical protein [Bacteroidales bacterium]HRR03873.1 hypothetical protein [Bacteroidales bacterium]HRT14335.1 hypothetical protein [Bacteroidales bacterium]HXK74083.1 hypothetical protein [Bacteroidales bacterium]